MQKKINLINNQPARYIVNGLVATFVHFLVLTLCFKLLAWPSAGAANLVAAIFGISTSFLGNRYFVFHRSTQPLFSQIYRFIFLYISIALLHGGLMYVWVDIYVMNYIFGFLVATFMQMVLSYFGNKVLVFKA